MQSLCRQCRTFKEKKKKMSTKLYDWLFADIEEIIDMAGEQNG